MKTIKLCYCTSLRFHEVTALGIPGCHGCPCRESTFVPSSAMQHSLLVRRFRQHVLDPRHSWADQITDLRGKLVALQRRQGMIGQKRWVWLGVGLVCGQRFANALQLNFCYSSLIRTFFYLSDIPCIGVRFGYRPHLFACIRCQIVFFELGIATLNCSRKTA